MPKPSKEVEFADCEWSVYSAVARVEELESFIEDIANSKPGQSIDCFIVRANEIVDEWRGVGKAKAEEAP